MYHFIWHTKFKTKNDQPRENSEWRIMAVVDGNGETVQCILFVYERVRVSVRSGERGGRARATVKI